MPTAGHWFWDLESLGGTVRPLNGAESHGSSPPALAMNTFFALIGWTPVPGGAGFSGRSRSRHSHAAKASPSASSNNEMVFGDARPTEPIGFVRATDRKTSRCSSRRKGPEPLWFPVDSSFHRHGNCCSAPPHPCAAGTGRTARLRRIRLRSRQGSADAARTCILGKEDMRR